MPNMNQNKFSTLAHALSNGPWKGLYLADEDAPHQYQSISCGVFMLMYAMYSTLKSNMISVRGTCSLSGGGGVDSCWRPLCLKALQN
ncbi:unnamed protein product [Boreogadus saida]